MIQIENYIVYEVLDGNAYVFEPKNKKVPDVVVWLNENNNNIIKIVGAKKLPKEIRMFLKRR